MMFEQVCYWIGVGVVVLGGLATCLSAIAVILQILWWLSIDILYRMGMWKVWLQMKRLHRPFMRWLAERVNDPDWEYRNDTDLDGGECVANALAALKEYDPHNDLEWRKDTP